MRLTNTELKNVLKNLIDINKESPHEFLINYWNTVEIDGKYYQIKLMELEDE